MTGLGNTARMTMMLIFALFIYQTAKTQCGPTDHGGADWIITTGTTIGGTHTNIGQFTINPGVTVVIDSTCHYLEIIADSIVIQGNINGDAVGEDGGSGGSGGAYANGSGVPGTGGYAGLAGSGTGGGNAGLSAGNGGTLTQICGGLFCSGNRDGLNGGGGGAGGGSGGSYGGASGIGAYGAYGSGFTDATGGTYGAGGAGKPSHGTVYGTDITWGSGGGGAGGGGGSWGSGTVGGRGGHGGGMVSLKATYKLTVSGEINCNGQNGGDGGNGGGESDDGGNDCSSSGYSECSVLCTQSVFDAAGGAGGGAGGGSGGGILLLSNGQMSITGTLNVRGGNGGGAGVPNSANGTCFDDARGGAGGSGGRIKIFQNPCVNVNIAPVVSAAGGSGGAGVVNGNQGGDGTIRDTLTSPDYLALVAGDISLTDPMFCEYGDVPVIGSTSAANGGTGTYSYQWQYSVVDSISGFYNLPGATSLTCDPSLITQTNWYRRKAISGTCEKYSNVVKATVRDCEAIDESSPLFFSVFPNPNRGEFAVELNTIPSDLGHVSIYNTTGAVVMERDWPQGITHMAFNVLLEPGVYVILVSTGDLIGTKRFTVE